MSVHKTRVEGIAIIGTDIYPPRYVAGENPGTWVKFVPRDGMFRSCVDSAPWVPIERLKAPTVATFRQVMENTHWPAKFEDGFAVDIWTRGEHFITECQFTSPDEERRQEGATFRTATIIEGIRAANRWMQGVEL